MTLQMAFKEVILYSQQSHLPVVDMVLVAELQMADQAEQAAAVVTAALADLETHQALVHHKEVQEVPA